MRLFILVPLFLAVGCNRPEHFEAISLSDPSLAEFSDLQKVDRKGLRIPDLPSNASITVERGEGPYDAMLHVYSKQQSRTIAFKKVDGKMKWIHEQVVIEGPRKYSTVDGTFQEHVTFTYETSRVSDTVQDQLVVEYVGPEKALIGRKLSPNDVKPLLEKWLAP
jgi:hypothetical protein